MIFSFFSIAKYFMFWGKKKKKNAEHVVKLIVKHIEME